MRERSRSTFRLSRLNVLCLDHAPFRVLFLLRYSLFGQANDHNLRVVKCPQQFRQVTGLPTHGHTEDKLEFDIAHRSHSRTSETAARFASPAREFAAWLAGCLAAFCRFQARAR